MLEGAGRLAMHELGVPEPQPGSIVVRVTHGGVCGTDAHLLRGEVAFPYPVVLGHEGIGAVVDLGEGVVSDYAGAPVAPGDLVYWNPIAPCHHCWYCVVEKDFSSCSNANWFGPIDRPTWGSYADFVTLPPGAAFFRIPHGVSPDAVIAFGCALPAVLQGLERLGGIAPLDNVVVQGAGPVGLAAVLMAHLSGARQVVSIDSSQRRLDLARCFGATATLSLTGLPDCPDRRAAVLDLTDGRGADVVIEATGHREAFAEGVALCARNGAYLLIGLWASQGDIPFDPSVVVRNNLRLVGTQYAQAHHYHDALAIVARHQHGFPFDEVITHRCPLDAADEAIALVTSGEAGKVIMVPEAGRS